MYVLRMYVCMCLNSAGLIVRPPRNITICTGENIIVNCGYKSNASLPVTWIINGTSLTQEEVNSSSYNRKYQLNNPTTPLNISLTIYRPKGIIITQCVVHSTSNITSRPGIVTSIGIVIYISNATYMYVRIYVHIC